MKTTNQFGQPGPSRPNMTVPQRAIFNTGLRDSRARGENTMNMRTSEIMHNGRVRIGKLALGAAGVGIGIGALAGAAAYGIEHSPTQVYQDKIEKARHDAGNGYPASQNDHAVDHGAVELNPSPEEPTTVQSHAPKPTDIQPVNHG
jgi:hypothetical protein